MLLVELQIHRYEVYKFIKLKDNNFRKYYNLMKVGINNFEGIKVNKKDWRKRTNISKEKQLSPKRRDKKANKTWKILILSKFFYIKGKHVSFIRLLNNKRLATQCYQGYEEINIALYHREEENCLYIWQFDLFKIKYSTSLTRQIHLKEFMKIFGLNCKIGTGKEPSASPGAFIRISIGTVRPSHTAGDTRPVFTWKSCSQPREWKKSVTRWKCLKLDGVDGWTVPEVY